MQIKKKENKNNTIELRKNVNYKSNKNKEKPYLKKVTQKRKYQENRKEENNTLKPQLVQLNPKFQVMMKKLQNKKR